MEEAMLGLMYDIPDQKDIEKVVITKDFILGKGAAKIIKKKATVA